MDDWRHIHLVQCLEHLVQCFEVFVLILNLFPRSGLLGPLRGYTPRIGAFGFEVFDHVSIMHDLMADIDRRSMFFDGEFDDLYRPVDACAKATWSREKNLEWSFSHAFPGKSAAS